MDVSLAEIFLKQFVILILGLVTAYFAYKAATNAKQANDAVNHKGADEKTLRENVLDIRGQLLEIRETQMSLAEKMEAHMEKHP